MRGTLFMGAGVALTLSIRHAAAAPHGIDAGDPCASSHVQVVGVLPPRWIEPVARACTALATLPDVDPTAQLRVTAAGDDLIVEAVLEDGRTASRKMKKTAALRPTLEALLLVPGDAATEAVVNAPRAETRSAPPASALSPPLFGEPTAAHESVDVDVGVAIGGRLAAQGFRSFAPAAFAELAIGPWLFGMTLRWEPVQQMDGALAPGFEMETIGAGMLMGRRVELGIGTVDVAASPRLVSETQTFLRRDGEESRSATSIRLGTLVRLSFGHSSIRPTIELDGDCSPTRIHRDERLASQLPLLPSWSAGISAGAMWSTR